MINSLIMEQPLPESCKDHHLIGNWIGRRECHVRNDVLLIYKILQESQEIVFERVGTHSEVLKM